MGLLSFEVEETPEQTPRNPKRSDLPHQNHHDNCENERKTDNESDVQKGHLLSKERVKG